MKTIQMILKNKEAFNNLEESIKAQILREILYIIMDEIQLEKKFIFDFIFITINFELFEWDEVLEIFIDKKVLYQRIIEFIEIIKEDNDQDN